MTNSGRLGNALVVRRVRQVDSPIRAGVHLSSVHAVCYGDAILNGGKGGASGANRAARRMKCGGKMVFRRVLAPAPLQRAAPALLSSVVMVSSRRRGSSKLQDTQWVDIQATTILSSSSLMRSAGTGIGTAPQVPAPPSRIFLQHCRGVGVALCISRATSL